jgi:uncharacterized protein YuzB (UPF0349 family)
VHLTYLTHFDTCSVAFGISCYWSCRHWPAAWAGRASMPCGCWPIMMLMRLDWADFWFAYVCLMSGVFVEFHFVCDIRETSIYFCVNAGAVFLCHHLHTGSNLDVLAHGCPKICSFCQAASSFCNHLLLIRSLLVNSEMMDCVYSLLILKDIPYAVLVRCFHHLLLMSFRVVSTRAQKSHSLR